MTRKNSLARQVRRAYRQEELARVCTLREDRFGRAFGMQTVKVDQPASPYRSRSGRPEDYYHFRDNNSSVLAVAHLDTVVSQKGRTPRFRDTERGPLITSGALDDRLGAYVILHLLPKLGVTCDWLLTVGEESGASTAEYFDAQGKKYDWVIEFDRGSSTDVVMYQYEDRASRLLVEASGADMGLGSFSDIAYLEQLGVKCFNWGVGYGGNYHSESGYAYLTDTFAMVAKYLRFCEQNAGTAMPHDRHGFADDDYDDYGACAVCLTRDSVDYVTGYCLRCKSCGDCGLPEDDGCMCYLPRHIREEAAGTVTLAASGRPEEDWREMSWSEYCEMRPGKQDFDDVLCATCTRHVARCECPWDGDPGSQPVKLPQDAACGDCDKDLDACTCELDDAYQAAQDKDGPGTLTPAKRPLSLAPPWSEHRPGVPSGRKGGSDAAQAAGLSEDLTAAVTAYRDRSAVNPPAVFPDADLGWHESTKESADGLYVTGHQPGQNWARLCLRCAARWPHPVTDSREIHPEADCPGCQRCIVMNARLSTGAIHVIPAHLAGDSDLCTTCIRHNAALSATDR